MRGGACGQLASGSQRWEVQPKKGSQWNSLPFIHLSAAAAWSSLSLSTGLDPKAIKAKAKAIDLVLWCGSTKSCGSSQSVVSFLGPAERFQQPKQKSTNTLIRLSSNQWNSKLKEYGFYGIEKICSRNAKGPVRVRAPERHVHPPVADPRVRARPGLQTTAVSPLIQARDRNECQPTSVAQLNL